MVCVAAEANFFFTIRAEANFFFLIYINWNILINWWKITNVSHTHFTNLAYNIPSQTFLPFWPTQNSFSYFWEFPRIFLVIPEKFWEFPREFHGIPIQILEKKKFEKKSFRLAEAGFSDFVTQTKHIIFFGFNYYTYRYSLFHSLLGKMSF